MTDYQKIACFDVYYYEYYARACCIVFEINSDERIISEYEKIVKPITVYISGEFYKRELPCIISVYKDVKEDIDLIIIDGFVMLDDGKKGLGGYLFEALNKKVPIIGVAKTFYKGCRNYLKIYRGKSCKPLYVSSTGISLDYAAKLIEGLKGKNRIPDVLKRADNVSRGRG